ncbi:hypothetical protein Skr01_53280 [Sphaerisporangium krabiense]|uniref:CU044_5270 family protein n=1 Tax=Sphaerisporangium krabiense TaxID=763782 RepID=A0A7W8Z4T6_9ACTN|nr:CU044_5270 family protein [Sphaerisporangium krabiense]MBB5627088.1 hypothetical protein [Sphaerisporangium krabiense]GII65243.1 hypothetical protein Skr01_53280 [Sphaerisporangium krabiense]
MSDEIQQFTDARPSAPSYPEQARRAARDRLLAEATGRGRVWRPRFGWQAAGAFGLTLALAGGLGVALSSRPGPAATPGAMTVTSSANVTAPGQMAELDPRPDQFIVFESETMNLTEVMGDSQTTGRYLYRTYRKFYQSADGHRGLLWIEGRSPRQLPGRPLPEEAAQWKGGGWNEIAAYCADWPASTRRDYAYLRTLPATPAAMRALLYTRDGGDRPADEAAFDRFGELMRETYMPQAQRQALFEAAKAVPGVEEASGVKDSAGREGVALGRVIDGVLEQRILDPKTFMLLGERGTVVDAKAADAPAGTVLTWTAQVKVSVVDRLPDVKDATKDSKCEMTGSQSPSPTESGAPASETPSATPGEPSATP